MRIEVCKVLELGQPEMVAWGVAEKTGNPVLCILVGGQRVSLEVTPAEARDIGCAGIVASNACAQLRQQAAAAKTDPPPNGMRS
jgi:hypothetical protein